MENKVNAKPCSPGECCCYTVRGRKIICTACIGVCDCGGAQLLEAEQSAFHTSELAAATQAINKILTDIPQDGEGRTPAFIQTRMGVMLAWVTHESETARSENPNEIGVTSANDNETIAKALNLKNFN